MPPKGPKLNGHQKRELKKRLENLQGLGSSALEESDTCLAHGDAAAALEALEVAEAKYNEVLEAAVSPQPDARYNIAIAKLHRVDILESIMASTQNAAQAYSARIDAEQSLEAAVEAFQITLQTESSGRGEVSALAHAALASVYVRQAEAASDLQERITLVTRALEGLGQAERVRSGLASGVDAELMIQHADTFGAMMVLYIEAYNESGGALEAEISQHFLSSKDTYNKVLENPVANDDGVDSECMQHKAKLYHDFAAWALESQRETVPSDMISSVLIEARGLVLGLATVDPQAAAAYDQLMVRGDILALCASHADSIVAEAGIARGFREEALVAYQMALNTPNGTEAQCSIAELFIDAGKSEAVLGDPEGLSRMLLEKAASAFTAVLANDSADMDCTYNLGCTAALLGNHDLCRAMLIKILSQPDGRNEALQMILNDPDLSSIHQEQWFIEMAHQSSY